MCPDQTSRPCRGIAGQQGGFAIIMAIFIVVVLGLLGGFIANVSTMQHSGSALDVMGAQAFQAARAGTEWGLSAAKTASACPASPSSFAVDTMTVTVTCAIVSSGAEVAVATIYALTATACNLPTGGGACPGVTDSPNYVERNLTVTAEF